MIDSSRPRLAGFAAMAAIVVLTLFVSTAAVERARAARQPQTNTLPAKLSDQEFWQLIADTSEPNGEFLSDNLVSNERPFQHVVPALRQMKRGGAYLGVAPDQNFTYILALEPRIAFILDIRRGNLLAHLMYKAIIELSDSRAQFLSKLFSRKVASPPEAGAPAQALLGAFASVQGDDAYYKENVRAIEDHLTKTHGFALSAEDLAGLEYVYSMFYQFGPFITYSSNRGRAGTYPTYAELQQATDLEGVNRAYLGSEDQFKALKAMEAKNLIVPIVGDFAGPKALRAIGRYLSAHGATVSAYYTSNVEQYLFQGGLQGAFYANVAQLPLDDASAFIRSARQSTVLDRIRPLLKDVADGKITTYADVTSRGSIR